MVEIVIMAIVQNVKALLMSQRRHVKVRESCIMQIIISVFCVVFIVGWNVTWTFLFIPQYFLDVPKDGGLGHRRVLSCVSCAQPLCCHGHSILLVEEMWVKLWCSVCLLTCLTMCHSSYSALSVEETETCLTDLSDCLTLPSYTELWWRNRNHFTFTSTWNMWWCHTTQHNIQNTHMRVFSWCVSCFFSVGDQVGL